MTWLQHRNEHLCRIDPSPEDFPAVFWNWKATIAIDGVPPLLQSSAAADVTPCSEHNAPASRPTV